MSTVAFSTSLVNHSTAKLLLGLNEPSLNRSERRDVCMGHFLPQLNLASRCRSCQCSSKATKVSDHTSWHPKNRRQVAKHRDRGLLGGAVLPITSRLTCLRWGAGRKSHLELSASTPQASQLPQEAGAEGSNKRQAADSLPDMAAIQASILGKGVEVKLSTLGPFFSVEAKSTATGEALGRAEGFVRPTLRGPLLHLDTIRLDGQGLRGNKGVRGVLGVGFMIGALTVRHGIDMGCTKAELLAINDTDEFHEKLVRYYQRLGFRSVLEVKGDKISDMRHMLVWGGVGTKMEADLVEILNRWKKLFER